MSDRLLVTILPDGTIRTETGPISAQNHQTADQFLRDCAILTGGPVTRTARAKEQAATVAANVDQK